jgi:hypothetical protein
MRGRSCAVSQRKSVAEFPEDPSPEPQRRVPGLGWRLGARRTIEEPDDVTQGTSCREVSREVRARDALHVPASDLATLRDADSIQELDEAQRERTFPTSALAISTGEGGAAGERAIHAVTAALAPARCFSHRAPIRGMTGRSADDARRRDGGRMAGGRRRAEAPSRAPHDGAWREDQLAARCLR